METVQIFGREKQQYERYSDLTAQFRDANLRSVINFAIFVPSVEFLGSLAVVLLLYVEARHADPAATLTFGTLVAFIRASQRFFQPIRDLADKFNIMQTAMTASERIFKLLDTDETIPVRQLPLKQIEGHIEFRNVWFAYHEEEWVLKTSPLQFPWAAAWHW